MNSYRKELWFNTSRRREYINITPVVEQELEKSGIKEGLILVNAMHITSSVFINDDESGLHHDYDVWLEKLAPHEPVSQYRHNMGEDNADAHLKRTIMGREVVVAISDGRLDFGPWEQIHRQDFFPAVRRSAWYPSADSTRSAPTILICDQYSSSMDLAWNLLSRREIHTG